MFFISIEFIQFYILIPLKFHFLNHIHYLFLLYLNISMLVKKKLTLNLIQKHFHLIILMIHTKLLMSEKLFHITNELSSFINYHLYEGLYHLQLLNIFKYAIKDNFNYRYLHPFPNKYNFKEEINL